MKERQVNRPGDDWASAGSRISRQSPGRSRGPHLADKNLLVVENLRFNFSIDMTEWQNESGRDLEELAWQIAFRNTSAEKRRSGSREREISCCTNWPVDPDHGFNETCHSVIFYFMEKNKIIHFLIFGGCAFYLI